MERGPLRVFTGNANRLLSERVAAELGLTLGLAEVGRFPDGEVKVEIGESVRGTDCFLIQPTCQPVNENLVELLIMIDAFRRGSADRITVVIPYFGYARQDRKAKGREPISAKLVANLIATAGADRILAVDLHTDQLQGFFDIPVDHLPARHIFADHFRLVLEGGDHTVVVSPDVGGVNQARLLADELGASGVGMVVKRRLAPGQSEVQEVIGDFDGRRVIMLDDMIQTGGTIIEAASAVLSMGAAEVYCAATHAVLSGAASEKLQGSVITSLVVTDTIPVPPERYFSKLNILSVSALLADAIKRIHKDQSVSACLRDSHYNQPPLFEG